MEVERHQSILAQVRTAVVDLGDVQNELRKNASESKNDIHFSISRQLESLRTREVWLTNQVDTVLQIKQEHLQHQAEGLSKELGALESLCEQAKSSGSGAGLEFENIMKRFQELSLNPEEDSAISFQGDGKRLKQAIQSYGSVAPKRLRVATDEVEMKDSQHASFIGKVVEPFEQFAKHQVWLTERQDGDRGIQDKAQHMAFPVFEDKQNGTYWLLKELGDGFMMVDSTSSGHVEEQGSFVMVPQQANPIKPDVPIASHFSSILTSPHVQWICPKSKTATVGVSRHQVDKSFKFYQPSSNPKDWLKDPSQRLQKEGQNVSKEQEMDVEQSHNSCTHATTKPTMPIEIEELAELACVQETPSGAPSPCSPKTSTTSRQQRKQDKNSPKPSPQQSSCCSSSVSKTSPGVSIEDVCKGNETCKSFDECLGDENCAIQHDSRNWLRQTQDTSKSNSTWLSTQSSSKQHGHDSSQSKPLQPSTSDVRQWLSQGVYSTGSYGESSIVTSLLKWQSEKVPSWLQGDGNPTGSKSPDQPTDNQWLKMTESNRVKTSGVNESRGLDEFKNKMNPTEWLLSKSPGTGNVSPKQMPSKVSEADSSMWVKKSGIKKAPSTSPNKNKGSVQEKWLLKRAFGSSTFMPRQTGIPYFSPQVSHNQWLKM